jgi:hypothetical protein
MGNVIQFPKKRRYGTSLLLGILRPYQEAAIMQAMERHSNERRTTTVFGRGRGYRPSAWTDPRFWAGVTWGLVICQIVFFVVMLCRK